MNNYRKLAAKDICNLHEFFPKLSRQKWCFTFFSIKATIILNKLIKGFVVVVVIFFVKL